MIPNFMENYLPAEPPRPNEYGPEFRNFWFPPPEANQAVPIAGRRLRLGDAIRRIASALGRAFAKR